MVEIKRERDKKIQKKESNPRRFLIKININFIIKLTRSKKYCTKEL